MVLAGLSLAAGTAMDHVKLVDDRGKPLATPVDACFQIELRQSCVPVAPGADIALLSGFLSLKIEGNDYGPLLLTAAEVRGKLTAASSLAVSRKATLQIRRRDRDQAVVGLSLYRLDEPDLRRPFHRLDGIRREPFKIPAGELLVSLSQPGSAPDLHVIAFAPGSRHQLELKHRPGWSLVLRVIDSETHRPLPGAAMDLQAVPGYSRASYSRGPTTTDRYGFVLACGLTDVMLQATVRRRDYVDREVRGLLASPGSFAYQAVSLERGGTVRTTIRLEGKPAAGASCQLARYVRRPVGKSPPPEVLSQGLADASGECVTQPLATGRYISRVSLPDRAVRAEKSVEVTLGQESRVELDLSPIALHGTVKAGSRPAAGFHVEVYSDDAVIPSRTAKEAMALGTTDEDGEYDATLWSAGSYSLVVTTPQGTPATAKRVELSPPEEVADFQLDAGRVFGTVVDGEGKPVEGAAVLLRWEGPNGRNTRVGLASQDGSFSFPMEAAGPVVLESHREGYRSSEPIPAQFISGADVGPVTLVVRQERTLRGIVLSAAGAPLGQAWIASYATLTGEVPRPIGTATTQADGSFELRIAKSGVTRLFFSGPGCPLAAFTVVDSNQEIHLPCAGAPAALGLQIRDRNGSPIAGANLILRKGGDVFPRETLAIHLGLLQLPAETDSSGRLVVAGLTPGDYDVYLATSTSEGLVGLGASQGYLGSFTLAPLRLTEVEAQVDWTEPIVERVPP